MILWCGCAPSSTPTSGSRERCDPIRSSLRLSRWSSFWLDRTSAPSRRKRPSGISGGSRIRRVSSAGSTRYGRSSTSSSRQTGTAGRRGARATPISPAHERSARWYACSPCRTATGPATSTPGVRSPRNTARPRPCWSGPLRCVTCSTCVPGLAPACCGVGQHSHGDTGRQAVLVAGVVLTLLCPAHTGVPTSPPRMPWSAASMRDSPCVPVGPEDSAVAALFGADVVFGVAGFAGALDLSAAGGGAAFDGGGAGVVVGGLCPGWCGVFFGDMPVSGPPCGLFAGVVEG